MDVRLLIGLQAVGGAATAFYSPASSGLVPQVVRPEQLQQANGFMSIARYAAFPLGAAVGGTIVATIGSGWALLLDGGTYAASVLLLAGMRLPERARLGAAPNFVRELREGWQAFTEHLWVWASTLWISLYFLITYAPFFVLGPYVAKQSLHGASSWAVVVTGEALGALGGGLVALRLRPNRVLAVIAPLFMTTALQSVLLAAHAPVAAIGAAAILAGFAFSYASVVWETTLQRVIAPEKLSRVSAYNWLGAMAFLPAGYAIAGPLAHVIGVSAYLVIGAVWIVASTAALLCVREIRDLRDREELPEPLAAAAAAS
jgi:predicted MFS family arabinose efflux permease